jgi:hypothetical protein
MPLLKYLQMLVIVTGMLVAGMANAKEDIKLYEQEIKAGLLYNFLKYTNWPQERMAGSNKINLCVFGPDPFGGYLLPLRGRGVNQKEISLSTIVDIGEDINSCHLLFINASEKAKWPELSKYLVGKNIVTVSDIKGFTSSGGMIEFTRNNDRVSVELNEDALAAANLSVQDRLRKLVTVVHKGDGGGK